MDMLRAGAIVVILLGVAAPVLAQPQGGTFPQQFPLSPAAEKNSAPGLDYSRTNVPEPDEPMFVKYDQHIVGNNGNRWVSGHVEASYNRYTILADELFYDNAANTLTALGHVRITEPDGATVTAERVTLSKGATAGFLRSFQR